MSVAYPAAPDRVPMFRVSLILEALRARPVLMFWVAALAQAMLWTLVPALFFASLIVFVIVRLVPGNIIDMMLSQNDVGADKLSRDQLVAALGLDRPMWQQYFSWIGGILLHADFGKSLWQNTPVRELLAARMPITFQLGLMALIVALLIAIPIGIYSAIRQDTAGDYLTRSFSILMLMKGCGGSAMPCISALRP